MNGLRGEDRANLVAGERELATLKKKWTTLVTSMMKGVSASKVKDELVAIASRREQSPVAVRRDRVKHAAGNGETL
ncbi:MAG: hypothetical protein ABIW19_04785 [Vicinamibacterales bacterium]